jgi:hypothetical protein
LVTVVGDATTIAFNSVNIPQGSLAPHRVLTESSRR